MRTLRRNETVFEYFPPDGVTSDLNEFGEHTGELYPMHSDPVEYRGNISIPSGRSSHELYGTDTRYTHILVMSDPDVDIKEDGLIRWKGEMYEVTAARPSLNTFSAALQKKTANHAEPGGSG